jgi:hypothetical protein
LRVIGDEPGEDAACEPCAQRGVEGTLA